MGTYNSKEIDFVATNNKETIYIQVCEQLPESSNRELENLLNLPTGHKKLLHTNNYGDVGSFEGVPIVHINDFLLNIDY